MDYRALYEYRFSGIDQSARQRVWNEIARFLYAKLDRPRRVLDPAAGRCEFINAIPAEERWVVDEVDHAQAFRAPAVRVVIGDALSVDLPQGYFDAVFISNFLEHLASPRQISEFLVRMRLCLAPGGIVAVMGPNFKYCASEYFDCADHVLALSHIAVAEHLYAAGYAIREIFPKFLPFSFRSILPASPLLTCAYLRLPPLWSLLGKQFLLIAQAR